MLSQLSYAQHAPYPFIDQPWTEIKCVPVTNEHGKLLMPHIN